MPNSSHLSLFLVGDEARSLPQGYGSDVKFLYFIYFSYCHSIAVG